jgi:phage tail-like protein
MPERYAQTLYSSLPAIYRIEDKTTFLKRLLEIFGEALDGLDDEVYGFHRQFDPARCDERFLPWLASWVALTLDETWDVPKRRTLIARAVILFRTRGTVPGLREFVEIYTGLKADIVEECTGGWQVGARSTVGVDTRVFGTWDENAHRFSVVINSFEPVPGPQLSKIKEIVEENKPAHTLVTAYYTSALFWTIGVRSTVGVDLKAGG